MYHSKLAGNSSDVNEKWMISVYFWRYVTHNRYDIAFNSYQNAFPTKYIAYSECLSDSSHVQICKTEMANHSI